MNSYMASQVGKSGDCSLLSSIMPLNSHIDLPSELWEAVGAHLQPTDLFSLGQVRLVFFIVPHDLGWSRHRRPVES